MSRKVNHGRKVREVSKTFPVDEREQFIRDNAVAVFHTQERLIERLRKELTFMNNRCRCYRKQLDEAKA